MTTWIFSLLLSFFGFAPEAPVKPAPKTEYKKTTYTQEVQSSQLAGTNQKTVIFEDLVVK